MISLTLALEFIGLLLSIYATATGRAHQAIGFLLIGIFVVLLVLTGGVTL